MSDIANALLGGFLIGLGSLLAMMASGKVPGLSGVVAKLLRPKRGDVGWRLLFLFGLVVGASLLFLADPRWRALEMPGGRGFVVIAVAGVLVGFGARLGGGCTSGHGVCGIGAGARDAVVYTLVFMVAGALTVLLWNFIMLS